MVPASCASGRAGRQTPEHTHHPLGTYVQEAVSPADLLRDSVRAEEG